MSDYLAGIRFRSDSRDIRKSNKDLARMEKQSRKTDKAASALGRTLGRAFAGLSAGLAFRAVIKNTIEQEKATTQLNAALKATGRYSPELSKALQNQAKALQSVTTFGDEAVIGAQGLLLTFKQLGSEVFPRATEAVLDMSYAMDQDLKSTVVQVGKALNDPIAGITALSRVGVTFTQQQKDVIKSLAETGRVAEAQKLILKELESEFGGSARAARNTFGGALKAVQNAFGDLLEADGDSLPAVISALNELEDVLQRPDVQEGFQKMAVGAANLVGTLAQLPGAFGYVKDEVREFFGLIDNDDIPRIEDEIARLQKEIGEATAKRSNNAISRLLISEEDIREAQERLNRFKKLRDDFYNGKRKEDPNIQLADLSGLDLPGGSFNLTPKLDADGINFDIDGLDEWIDNLERGQDATEAVRTTLNSLAADMGGPVVQAGLQLSDTMAMLDEQENTLRETGELTLELEQQLASARALATQQYNERVEAINATLTPAQELIESLREEVELIGLSNVERERTIALRLAGAEATDAEIEQINRLINEKAKLQEVEAQVNQFRQSGEDALASFIDGSKSASEAFDDFADSVIKQVARLAAQKAIEALFGASFGGGPEGSGGGLFGTVFSSLFGPGRALGGPVYPGRLHPVVERGEPEMLTIGRTQYLLTGSQQGKVEPIKSTTNNSRQTTNNIIVQAVKSDKTLSQTASRVAREQRKYETRNR